MDLVADIGVENSNAIDLQAQSVTATLTLDGRYPMGTVTVTSPLTLPAKKKVTLSVPMTVQWGDMVGLGALALAGRDVPYTLQGDVALGTSSFNIKVPFTLRGTMTREQLTQATLRSFPIPGLFR
jgi:LEA14-like dessication related protein